MSVDRDHVLDQYSAHVNPPLARLKAFAGFGAEVSAEGCVITDSDGREYLDFLGGYGVFSLGHRHPKVVDAVQRQLGRMPISSKVFLNPLEAELATRLSELAPEGLEFTFFSNSGAEAVEAALKFAKVSTGRSNFVACTGGYHGKTMGALSVTGRDKFRVPFEPVVPGTTFVPFGDFDALENIDSDTAAFIVEPVQGEGGILIPPDGYLTAARKRCDEVGALLIVDEVQTGLGRTGYLFACEHDGVRPDLMTLAKCLGGGVMPIGATMGTRAVWDKVYGLNPLLHTSTFGGNPLAMAAGLAALEVVQEEKLAERSRVLGERLLDGLQKESESTGLVHEVRGRGLMVGVEFAQDEVGELCIAQMTMRGMIAAYSLNNPRVLRFEPPLTMTEAQVDEGVRIFGEALRATADLLAALA